MKKSNKEYHLKLLNDFANQLTLAKDIEVTCGEYSKSFKPRDGMKAKYEDAIALSSIVNGAEQFLYYLERKGIKVPSKR